ncbi:MAG TPA: sulfotransferase [Steroidobacteraceae bacterium]|nr:sulfotransferase [Steroidobacteraceae bacterium]
MSGNSEPVGTVEVALAHSTRLLETDPGLAAEQAIEILKVSPGHPAAALLLGVARRRGGNVPAAIEALEELTRAHPKFALAHLELAFAYGTAGRGESAVRALLSAVALKPDLPDAWRTLGDHLTAMGETERADAAYANHIRTSTRDPRLLEPAAALCDGRVAVAEALLREHLKAFPTDVAAIRMLAEVATRLGRLVDAELLLERCLELAPSFTGARHNYAVVLHRQTKSVAALREIERLLAAEPRNPGYRNLKAAALARLGEYDGAIAVYREVLGEYPGQAKVWMSFGHALKTAGDRAESIDAYRRSIGLAPGLGEAYWSLANLKTFRFEAGDVAAMERQLKRNDLSIEDRLHFHFALGKALEDTHDYARSFEHYVEGNRQRRALAKYDASEMSQYQERSRRFFTREFFEARRGFGSRARDPIFIVGLPRSGSTLVEQILASHSAIEGTMELPDLPAMARTLGRGPDDKEERYPEVLGTLTAAELEALGEQYLRQTRVQRKTAAPYFIDKLPNNFAHVGFIQLILPQARIIDVRRHPLGCCFSGFKQHFARGQHFTYGLKDIGRYYRDYVELTAHYDTVLPGRVHRVIYETLVDDTEGEVRRLLAYCGLEFEAGCLRFHENERAVRTASSEQVRTPIYRDGLEQWRNYNEWLGPLRDALGPVVEAYPAAPTL